MASQQEFACIYAALALQDDGVTITGEKIQSVLNAAGVSVDPFWPGAYAKALQGVDVKKIISNVGSGVGMATAALSTTTAVAAAPSKEVEKKKVEEAKEESDDDMGFGLFD